MYNTISIIGSPITQTAGAAGDVTVSGEGLYQGEEDKLSSFLVDPRGQSGAPEVSVEGECLLTSWLCEVG